MAQIKVGNHLSTRTLAVDGPAALFSALKTNLVIAPHEYRYSRKKEAKTQIISNTNS